MKTVHGATHYTHWFQPMTGLTAEKHDRSSNPRLRGRCSTSGSSSARASPTSSSSGGLRATRGLRLHRVIRPSPAFVRKSASGDPVHPHGFLLLDG